MMIQNGIYIILVTVFLGAFTTTVLYETKEKVVTSLIMMGISVGVGFGYHPFFYALIPAIIVGNLLGMAVKYTSRKRRIRCRVEAMKELHPEIKHKKTY